MDFKNVYFCFCQICLNLFGLHTIFHTEMSLSFTFHQNLEKLIETILKNQVLNNCQDRYIYLFFPDNLRANNFGAMATNIFCLSP